MAEALRKAIEIFAAAPQSPTSAAPVVPGHDQRENLIRSAKRFEESVARWRADMLIVQQGLAHMYENLSALPDGIAISHHLSKLDEFIEHVDNELNRSGWHLLGDLTPSTLPEGRAGSGWPAAHQRRGEVATQFKF